MPDNWLAVALRFALYLDLMVAFGVALFGLYAMRPDERSSVVARRYVYVIGLAAVLGIGLSLASMVVMAKAMTGATEYAELTAHVFGMIMTATSVGLAWTARIVVLLAALAVIAMLRTRPTLRFGVSASLGAAALATVAWAGHGAMDDGTRGGLHLASDIVHLLAAGAWVGALFAFVILSKEAREASPEAAERLGRASNGFAHIGTMIVATLVLTGAVNYLLIMGPTAEGLLTTAYGGLLLAKLALFALMLVLAAANRYRLSPRLAGALKNGDHTEAVAGLRQSLITETCLAVLILVLVACLGVLSPAGA
ncbi:copper homeostasis membrane protein CopD [Ralstonia solanacearum]|uniref:Copper resistance protein CopD n=2 Tax=Ralstonia solanacearum TaxID=305 RepID=A0A5H2PQ68_RALSL|nr:copper homeostasis membrane protein CopD [Ralstonia solanacearum]AEG71065.1 copper resistance protein d [Ralstonia solanacearum Po82]AMP72115.1 copper resistance protein CopD [Ralstonia solanacearum]AMP76604.1 copper resistance protein CopD [Ralstonia solanacearum]AYB62500.1 copper resistance protein CopD [Ralstonia solanacearum]EUJ12999.1 copper resistance protein CopD [Ralstonia solanacearum P673]